MLIAVITESRVRQASLDTVSRVLVFFAVVRTGILGRRFLGFAFGFGVIETIIL